MVESIVKTELPQSTLDMIKAEKQGYGSQRRYEFHLILNQNGMLERMQLMTSSYEELRLWIIGLNALLGNKNNLMRLSSLIKT